MAKKDFEEASLWYYNAAFEVSPVLDIETGGVIPLSALADCYDKLADIKQASYDSLPPQSHGRFNADLDTINSLRIKAADFRKKAQEWLLPDL